MFPGMTQGRVFGDGHGASHGLQGKASSTQRRGFQISKGPFYPREGRLCAGRFPTEPSRRGLACRMPPWPALRPRAHTSSWRPGAPAFLQTPQERCRMIPGVDVLMTPRSH